MTSPNWRSRACPCACCPQVDRLAQSQRDLEEAQARLSLAVRDRRSVQTLSSEGGGGVASGGWEERARELEGEVGRLRGGGGGWEEKVAGLEGELEKRDKIVLDLQRRVVALGEIVAGLERELGERVGGGGGGREGEDDGRSERLQVGIGLLPSLKSTLHS